MIYLLLFLAGCIPKINELERNGIVSAKELLLVCKEEEETCQVGLASSVGSATRILWNGDYYWLTAGHVCFSTNDSTEAVSIERAIFVTESGTGKSLPVKEILVDQKRDLCLLSANPGAARSLASSEPELGSTVQTIAYPGGAFDPHILPVYDGRWAGKMQEENKCIVTIPVAGGSSGASIINNNGEVVGVVSSVMKTFNHFTLVSCLEDVKGFLSEASELKK